jgi:hypothetical protein
MSDFNNYNFNPGNKANLKLFLKREFLRQYYNYFNTKELNDDVEKADLITTEEICQCFPFRSNPTKQGYNDPSQIENIRVARVLTGTLGGKTTFGNLNAPVPLNYLGGWEGQPGGAIRPLRNKF